MPSGNYLQLGIKRGLISLSDNGKRITYCAVRKSYKFTDPEELVRAEYYVELVVTYGYSVDCMDVEVVVPRRTPSDLADIVVYRDPRRKQPYIVVECKKDGTSDSAFAQAVEQAFGNTNSLRGSFAALIAGNTRRFFDVGSYPASERTKNIIADIPVKYGQVEESKFRKDDPSWDIAPVEKSVLVQALGKCHDTLWDGGKMDATEAFDALCKFIFVKMQDEMRPRKGGTPYDFQIKTNETPASVHTRVSDLYQQAMAQDPDVFSDAFTTDSHKTFSIVNHLQSISLSKTDLDTKGVAFESFMEDFFKGKQGQFFTPREIVRFVLGACDFDHNSLVLDPACGSGGFLLYAMDHIRSSAGDYYEEGSAAHYRHWHEFASNRLFGIEVNDRISRVAKMNMVLHDDGHTNVICHDALDDLKKLGAANHGLEPGRFDLILTNPPFGAKVKFDEKPYSNSYVLGRTSKGETRKEQQSEILFIERCWEFLKPGEGHLAIVVPDGILTNHTQRYVRDFILEKFEIKAIVSLPQVTFMHYGAGVKSSVLVARKKSMSEDATDYPFFAAVSKAVGYDATGRAGSSDLGEILTRYAVRHTLEQRPDDDLAYTKRISQSDQSRLDPYYYSPSFDEIDRVLAGGDHRVVPLREICEPGGIFSGGTPKKEDYSEKSNDSQIIKVSSLRMGRVDLGRTGRVKPEAVGKKRTRDGDILILSAAHQSDYIGRNPCIVELPDDASLPFVAELMCIRVNQEIVNPYYLLQLLSTRTFFRLVNREKRGQTSHIYPRDIRKIRIPVPDLEVQNRTARAYKTAYANYRKLISDAEQFMTEASREFSDTFTPSRQKKRGERVDFTPFASGSTVVPLPRAAEKAGTYQGQKTPAD